MDERGLFQKLIVLGAGCRLGAAPGNCQGCKPSFANAMLCRHVGIVEKAGFDRYGLLTFVGKTLVTMTPSGRRLEQRVKDCDQRAFV